MDIILSDEEVLFLNWMIPHFPSRSTFQIHRSDGIILDLLNRPNDVKYPNEFIGIADGAAPRIKNYLVENDFALFEDPSNREKFIILTDEGIRLKKSGSIESYRDWGGRDVHEVRLDFVDKLVRLLPETGDFEVSIAAQFDNLSENEVSLWRIVDVDHDIEKLMIRFGYLQPNRAYSKPVTSAGLDAKRAGGHYAYQKQLKERDKPHVTNITNIYGDNSGIVAPGADVRNSSMLNRLPPATKLDENDWDDSLAFADNIIRCLIKLNYNKNSDELAKILENAEYKVRLAYERIATKEHLMRVQKYPSGVIAIVRQDKTAMEDFLNEGGFTEIDRVAKSNSSETPALQNIHIITNNFSKEVGNFAQSVQGNATADRSDSSPTKESWFKKLEILGAILVAFVTVAGFFGYKECNLKKTNSNAVSQPPKDTAQAVANNVSASDSAGVDSIFKKK